MEKRNALESGWEAVLDITLVPALARLPEAVPAERRDVAARHRLLRRIHNEFEEMPGMSLTLGQAARLFGLAPDIASRILVRLADERVLHQRSDGRFALRVTKS